MGSVWLLLMMGMRSEMVRELFCRRTMGRDYEQCVVRQHSSQRGLSIAELDQEAVDQFLLQVFRSEMRLQPRAENVLKECCMFQSSETVHTNNAGQQRVTVHLLKHLADIQPTTNTESAVAGIHKFTAAL
jgi:hypothetical protein